jgi:hypothetical protein
MYHPRLHPHHLGFDDVIDHRFDTRSLFVVGCARSGTSILLDIVNTVPDVFLFGEANFALNFHIEDFPDWYNLKHHQHGMVRGKSSHAPYLGPRRLHDYLRLLFEHYRLVGDKIAFGPHGLYNGAIHQENVFQFHERFFFRSPHLFIFRQPRAVLRSLQVKFPQKDFVELARCWLLTADLFADMSLVFPAVHLVLFERLPDALDDVGTALGLDLSMSASLFAPRDQGAEAPRFQEFEPAVVLCESVYRCIEAIASANGSAASRWTLTKQLRRRVAAGLDVLDDVANRMALEPAVA